MDGFEVAKELRAEASLGRTLLVALSGYALAEDRKRAAEAGFARHLAKPPDLQSLCKLLADPDLAASGFSTSSEDGVILRG
jgi:CheY-like chemotaxis protein